MTPEIIAPSKAGLAGVAAIRAMLSLNPDDADTDLATRRARLAAFAAAAPAPTEPVVEARIGGVRVLRIAPAGAGAGAGTRGRIVYLHGGAYVLGSADTHARLAAAFAHASGAEVIAVDYRLAPEHPYPAAVDDAVAVWSALAGDDVPTALIGDSAGGGLVLATALRLRDTGAVKPVALAMTSPWVDLTVSAASLTERADEEVMLSQAGLALDASRYRGALPAADPRVSPLFADLAGLPPVFVQVGSAEILFDDAMSLATRLGEAGVAVRLQVWEGMAHAWAAYGDAVPEAAASVAALGDFVRERLAA